MLPWCSEMHTVATKVVTCPHCGDEASVSLPSEETELNVRHSVAAFGEYTTITCSNGHTYWVYFC